MGLSLLGGVRLRGGVRAGYGLASALAIMLARRGNDRNMLSSIVGDFAGMQVLMKRLALVQFFSWSALFIMWIHTTPIVAQYNSGATNAARAAYHEASNWGGGLFAINTGIATNPAPTDRSSGR